MTRLNFTTGTSIGEAFASMAKDSQFLINDGVCFENLIQVYLFKNVVRPYSRFFKLICAIIDNTCVLLSPPSHC